MAHPFVEAFPDEVQAFTAFAEDFPGTTTFLVLQDQLTHDLTR